MDFFSFENMVGLCSKICWIYDKKFKNKIFENKSEGFKT